MTTESDTITITLKLNADEMYQAFIGDEPCGSAKKGAGEAARSAAMSLGAAETTLNSGSEHERLDQTGLAIIMKAVLGLCVDHLQRQITAATLEQRIVAGVLVKKLMAAKRIPVNELMTAVLETLLSARMVLPLDPMTSDEVLAVEVQDMFRKASKP